MLFGFVYPDRRDCVPPAVVDALTKRLAEQKQEPANRACFGTLLSREQYLHDLESGYVDARLPPHGSMRPDHIKLWTDAIGKKA